MVAKTGEEGNRNRLWRNRTEHWTRKLLPNLSVVEQIHQQLDTRQKLFCACNPVLRKDEPEFTIMRRLRPTQSELGEIDPAALFEFKKGKIIIYEGYLDTTCLVEADIDPFGSMA